MFSTEWLSLIQTAAVVFSLLGLIWSLRQHAKQMKGRLHGKLLELMLAWRSNIILNPKLVDEWKQSAYFQYVLKKYGIRKYFHTLNIFHILQYVYLAKIEKIVDTKLWAGWSNNVKAVMSVPQNRSIWEDIKATSVYHERFVKEVDTLIAELQSEPIVTLFIDEDELMTNSKN